MALTWLMKNMKQKEIENRKYIILREKTITKRPTYEK